jgi:mono/diheme cytochrome c family protein
MSASSKNLKRLGALGVAAGLGLLVWAMFYSVSSNSKSTVSVKLANLSSQARAGQVAFDANCASCHGKNTAGTEKGPPFVHDIYNPGHHPDAAFSSAVHRGVAQHHWPYGDMPAQPQVTDQEVADIVRYVRELQEANGIVYHMHQM